MGQKDRARQIIDDRYNFSIRTSAGQERVYEIADHIAAGLKLKLGASLARHPRWHQNGETKVADYVLKGPGGLMTVASLGLATGPRDERGTAVDLSVNEFTFQKGALGTKPTINGSKHLDRFVDALKIELELG